MCLEYVVGDILSSHWLYHASPTVSHRAMLKNPEDYPEPDAFKPERFIGTDGQIDPKVRDPNDVAFGFGRRSVLARSF